MKFFIGVDGGQSSTTALIGDENGTVLSCGRGGPCNHAGTSGGRERFTNAIQSAVQSALDNAGSGNVRFEAACFGLSGGPDEKEAIARELVSAEQYLFTHDAHIALTGATAGEPGVITIAGTGSISFGTNSDGDMARAGGWGYVFGDEGSGFDIVRRALRAVLRHEEGWGPPTALREHLLAATGMNTANHLLHEFYTDRYSRASIASLAKVVDVVAQSGDRTAHDILNTTAQSLATFTAAVRSQLFGEDDTPLISYAGGVFKSAVVYERFRMIMELEGNQFAEPRYMPAAGALIEAYRLAGLDCHLSNVPQQE